MVDRPADLRAMRTALLAAMDGASVADLPRICRELRAVDLELEALTPPVTAGQELVDQLKERRARRG